MSTAKRPPRRKSHDPNESKWEHPPPTPLHHPNESCFPPNRSYEGYMKYYDDNILLTTYYFVLSNNFLLAGEHIDSTKFSKVIPVEGKTINIDTANDGYKFIIKKNTFSHHFETSSRNETEKWMEVISKACDLKLTDIYRLVQDISCGSCGTAVFAAENRSTRKRVAIKVINKKKVINKQRLSDEINIMRKLRHQPCIVQLYDVFETKKHLHLVMELCEGGDLLTTVANQPHFEDITCHVMHQIARAVNHMHKMNIVHRDLKPENILCCKKGSVERIKVADFGISKHMNLCKESLSTPVGTLTYTAPELLNGDLYGKEVDYWSLGVIMHIMLCGYSPTDHCVSEREIRREIVGSDVELKDEDWMHVTPQIKDLVLRLLHRKPKKRATNDEILQITWNTNKNHLKSWRNARCKLRKTVRGQICSTGTIEANIHLMNKVYSSGKYNKRRKKMKKPSKYYKTNPKLKKKHHKHNTNLSQSSTSMTDEECDGFAKSNSLNKNEIKVKKRKKSSHCSEPLFTVKYPNHEYRTRSRDDSELGNERLEVAAKSIERYIQKKKKEESDVYCDDDSDGFPRINGMSFRLFD